MGLEGFRAPLEVRRLVHHSLHMMESAMSTMSTHPMDSCNFIGCSARVRQPPAAAGRVTNTK